MELTKKITVGLCREETMTVGVNHTARALGSGSLPVLGTPAMTALMEQAATNLAQALLPEGWTSVGTALAIEHVAATPIETSKSFRRRRIVSNFCCKYFT